jgi:hypothetical protein
VNGIKPWDSYAKAVYIAKVHEWSPSVSLDEIADIVGDRHRTVSRLYQGYLVLQQAEGEGYPLEKNPDARLKFSHLYTAIDYPQVRRFLGLSKVKYNNKKPVPRQHLNDLRKFLVWLYGDSTINTRAVVRTQNPDLRRLVEVIDNRKALEALRDGGLSLDEAHRLMEDEASIMKGSLIHAKEDLQKAKGLALNFSGEEDTLSLMESIFELAKSLRDELTRAERSR